jgi:uncharacterized protein
LFLTAEIFKTNWLHTKEVVRPMQEARTGYYAVTEPAPAPRAWIISDGKAGHQVITTGVAEAMGLNYKVFPVAPRGLRRLFAPWAPIPPAKKPGSPTSAFRPPWPDFIFAAGRTTIPYLRALRQACGPKTYTVVFHDPRTGLDTADLIWVPRHDRLRGRNVISTVTAPHRFSAAKLAALAAAPLPAIESLPRPRIAVLIGGPAGTYDFPASDRDHLLRLLASAGRLGASFMITPSRRTPPELIDAVKAATVHAPRFFWDGDGENPYGHFLASADAFIVTGDSVNMVGEAASTGKPIYVLYPNAGRERHEPYHAALQAFHAVRPAPDEFRSLEFWDYQPLNSTLEVAGEILRRWHAAR